MPELPKIFHLQFTPEHWSRLVRLRALLGKPLPTTRESYEGLDACIGHLQKYQVFARIADRIIPNLPKDREELDRYGASRNAHSEEFGALTEAMLCELYSSLDGLLQFLQAVYPTNRELKKIRFASSLFQSAKENKLSVVFPEPVRQTLAAAYDDWFDKLRNLRIEITHGTVGFFSFDELQQSVTYFNNGLSSSSHQVFHIKDIVTVVRNFDTQVRALHEEIAKFFLSQLLPLPRMYTCGVYQGLLYIRMVAPASDLNFHSGHCASWNWFEQQPEKFCPLAKQCGAYGRKWPVEM
jgi:hypothetical protein